MWKAKTGHVHHRDVDTRGRRQLVAPFAAFLAAVATQHLTSRQAEMYSEVLCWMLLPILLKYVRSRLHYASLPLYGSGKAKSNGDVSASAALSGTGSGSSWLFALGIATACFFTAENAVIGFLPLLIPILLMIESTLWTDVHLRKEKFLYRKVPLEKNTVTAFAIALFGIYTLSGWSILGFAMSAGQLLGYVAVYATLLAKPSTRSNQIPYVDLNASIHRVAPRVVILVLLSLAAQRVFLGFVPFQVPLMLLTAITKCLTWIFVIQTAQIASLTAAPIIKIFSIFATRSPYTASFESEAICHLVGAGLTLGQFVSLWPKSASSKPLLWMLMLIPAVPYMTNTLTIHKSHSRVMAVASSHQQHPVEKIIHGAKGQFHELLAKQSRTYHAASEEYHRRYKMDPPPGYKEWFESAVSQKSVIIDDFDTMYQSLAPLWAVSGPQIRQAMQTVQSSGEDVWTCTFHSESGKTSCTHPFRITDRHISDLFNNVTLPDLRGSIPDVQFLVNHLDEPRVIFPRDRSGNTGIQSTQLSHRSTWSKMVQHCSRKESERSGPKYETYGMPFVQNMTDSLSICQHPEYQHMYGMFMSPTSMHLLEGMVPILSTGTPSTMGDILFPSPAYIEREFVYEAKGDRAWREKVNNLYWAGSTSGAYATDSKWNEFHRQRFVGFVQNLNGGEYSYLAQRGDRIQRISSRFINSRLYDVAFTRVFQSDKLPRRIQAFFYRLKAWAHKDAALRSRLVFDLDGNGVSGRWYKLLASNSTPLKQTLLREWHDDRLVPWVHYIPVSQSMEELPELVAYLLSTPQGQQHALEIAEQGAEWYRKTLRREDIAIYLHRLLLELARLQDPARPARV